jgi:RNA polymerase sigma factor (sigma-70 family)
MNHENLAEQLSQIVTDWRQILQAQRGRGEQARQARNAMAERYYGAIRRYLLGYLPGYPDLAEAIASDVITDILEGEGVLRRAGRKPGSFRGYVMRSLWNKVRDYYRALARRQQLPLSEEAENVEDLADEDDLMRDSLRAELLDRVWQALQAHEEETGQPLFALLRYKADRQDEPVTAQQLAEHLEKVQGKTYKPNHVNQLLYRARTLYAELVVREVIESLSEKPDEPIAPELIEQELIDLGLLNSFAKKALESL